MTKTQNINECYKALHILNREESHRHFGGKIYQSDFNTDYRGKDNINGSEIASRIESDWRWEQRLLKNGGDYHFERK